MTNTQNYENIHFHRTVNTIMHFPATFPTHWHKYVEILAMPEDAVSETAQIKLHNTTYKLKNGDLLFIWPGELHEISDNASGRLIGLQFSSTLFHELTDFSIFLSHFRGYHHIRHEVNPSLSEDMLYQLEQIIRIQNSNENFKGVEAFIGLLEFFITFGTYIQKELKSVQNESGTLNKTLEKIHEACIYISENCEQDITLEHVSEQIGFSACYFSRVFKQHTSYNFVEYLTMQRIKRAQTLLSDSNMSVTEISYQSGFKSISTFNRVFKQSRGCSPSEYRKYYAN